MYASESLTGFILWRSRLLIRSFSRFKNMWKSEDACTHTDTLTHIDFPSIPSDLQGSEVRHLIVPCVSDQTFLSQAV